MLTGVPHDAYIIYLKWLQDSLQIESRKDSESIYVDIVRHIILNTRTDPNAVVNAALINGASDMAKTAKPV